MLSSVLKSEKAINVNIQIIRTFVKLREILLTNKELREKIEKLESKYDQQFRMIFSAVLINVLSRQKNNSTKSDSQTEN